MEDYPEIKYSETDFDDKTAKVVAYQWNHDVDKSDLKKGMWVFWEDHKGRRMAQYCRNGVSAYWTYAGKLSEYNTNMMDVRYSLVMSALSMPDVAVQTALDQLLVAAKMVLGEDR